MTDSSKKNTQENQLEESNAQENQLEESNAQENQLEENNTQENQLEENNTQENQSKESNAQENQLEENNTQENQLEESNAQENQLEENNTQENQSKENNTQENQSKENNTQENQSKESNAQENQLKENNTQENQSKESNAQENQLNMSKIWSYIRCYFYVIFGYHFLFLVEESTGEKLYNIWSGYCIIISVLLILFLYILFIFNKKCINSILSFFKNQLKWIYCIIICMVSIIYVFNFFSIRDFLDDSFQLIKFLGLNDLGDFLSGVFSPLAFYFLYQNYVQYQKELKIIQKTLDDAEQEKEKKSLPNEQVFNGKIIEFDNRNIVVKKIIYQNKSIDIQSGSYKIDILEVVKTSFKKNKETTVDYLDIVIETEYNKKYKKRFVIVYDYNYSRKGEFYIHSCQTFDNKWANIE